MSGATQGERPVKRVQWQWQRLLRREEGAGSLLAVALIAAVLAATLLLLPLYTVLSARTRAEGAADAAALAAADAAIGIAPGIPCAVAADIAAANRARVTECQADGVIVTVGVSVAVLGFVVRSAATAGPPGAEAGAVVGTEAGTVVSTAAK